VFHALGRKTDLTGRASDIWPMLIPMAPNALFGAGFESFWLGPRMQKVWDAIPGLHVSEAHNGYLELYLNLGAIGIGLVILVVVHGYRRCVAAFRIDPDLGGLMLAYVMTVPVYSYTEAGFRMLFFTWSFLLVAIIGATRISKLTGENVQLDTTPSELSWCSATRVESTSVPVNY
jgi:exopolysaccharide production protein ExoQ